MPSAEDDAARWDAYWQSLTPDEQDEERRMMAAHVAESIAEKRALPPGAPRNYIEQRALLDESLTNIPPYDTLPGATDA